MAFVGFSDSADNLPTVAAIPPPPTSSSAVAKTDSENLFEFGRTHRVPAKVLQALATALDVEDEDALTLDFALIPEDEVNAIVATMIGAEGSPLNPLQRGAVMRLYRSATLYVPLQGLGPIQVAPKSSMPVRPLLSETSMEEEKVRMSAFVDEADDSYYRLLPATEIDRLRKVHVDTLGGPPTDAARPTVEQLSGLHAKLVKGKAPYVDLGLFGPYGGRTHRLRKLTAHIQIDGEWINRRVEGPPNLESWQTSWSVFRAAMLMLKAATATALDKYAAGIAKLVQNHGNWGMIMLADERCRGEQWELLSEKLAADPLRLPEGLSLGLHSTVFRVFHEERTLRLVVRSGHHPMLARGWTAKGHALRRCSVVYLVCARGRRSFRPKGFRW